MAFFTINCAIHTHILSELVCHHPALVHRREINELEGYDGLATRPAGFPSKITPVPGRDNVFGKFFAMKIYSGDDIGHLKCVNTETRAVSKVGARVEAVDKLLGIPSLCFSGESEDYLLAVRRCGALDAVKINGNHEIAISLPENPIFVEVHEDHVVVAFADGKILILSLQVLLDFTENSQSILWPEFSFGFVHPNTSETPIDYRLRLDRSIWDSIHFVQMMIPEEVNDEGEDQPTANILTKVSPPLSFQLARKHDCDIPLESWEIAEKLVLFAGSLGETVSVATLRKGYLALGGPTLQLTTWKIQNKEIEFVFRSKSIKDNLGVVYPADIHAIGIHEQPNEVLLIYCINNYGVLRLFDLSLRGLFLCSVQATQYSRCPTASNNWPGLVNIDRARRSRQPVDVDCLSGIELSELEQLKKKRLLTLDPDVEYLLPVLVGDNTGQCAALMVKVMNDYSAYKVPTGTKKKREMLEGIADCYTSNLKNRRAKIHIRYKFASLIDTGPNYERYAVHIVVGGAFSNTLGAVRAAVGTDDGRYTLVAGYGGRLWIYKFKKTSWELDSTVSKAISKNLSS